MRSIHFKSSLWKRGCVEEKQSLEPFASDVRLSGMANPGRIFLEFAAGSFFLAGLFFFAAWSDYDTRYAAGGWINTGHLYPLLFLASLFFAMVGLFGLGFGLLVVHREGGLQRLREEARNTARWPREGNRRIVGPLLRFRGRPWFRRRSRQENPPPSRRTKAGA